jgi:hypothetical protein
LTQPLGMITKATMFMSIIYSGRAAFNHYPDGWFFFKLNPSRALGEDQQYASKVSARLMQAAKRQVE